MQVILNFSLRPNTSGEWKNDIRHGWGTLYYPNGDRYEGYFWKGKKHGEVDEFFSST